MKNKGLCTNPLRCVILIPVLLRLTSGRRSGFLLIEALLGMVIFAIFLTAVGLTIFNGQIGSQQGGNTIRAVSFTEGALRVAENILTGSGLSALPAGSHGYGLSPTKKWILSGSAKIQSGYTTTITFEKPDSTHIRATSETTWSILPTRPSKITLAALFPDPTAPWALGNWSTLTLSGSCVAGNGNCNSLTNPLFNDIAVTDNHAFVTSEVSTGGAGLYIFNLTVPSAPTLAATFALGAGGKQLVLKEHTLYITTDSSTTEVRAYDVTTPTSPVLLDTYNLPSSGIATSLALGENMLYVGTSGGGDDLYSFNISDPSELDFRHSISTGAGTNGIAVSGTAAYLSTTRDDAELQVVTVTASGNLSLKGSYNMNDRTEDALTITRVGTSALLGTQRNVSVPEVGLFNVQGNIVPPPPPAVPWYHEASGSVVRVLADPTACYGFIATNWHRKVLKVIRLRDLVALSEASSWPFPSVSPSGAARGIFLDAPHNRLYLTTERGFYLFTPGSPPSECL